MFIAPNLCININTFSSFQTPPQFTEETPVESSRKDLIDDNEIFLATPILVEPDQSIDSKTDDSYSIINEEEEGRKPAEEDEDSSPNSSSNPPASLSFSEDSDTARIYDLHTMETRFEKRPTITTTTLSPETVKFFAPKCVPKFGKSSEFIRSEEKVRGRGRRGRR